MFYMCQTPHHVKQTGLPALKKSLFITWIQILLSAIKICRDTQPYKSKFMEQILMQIQKYIHTHFSSAFID